MLKLLDKVFYKVLLKIIIYAWSALIVSIRELCNRTFTISWIQLKISEAWLKDVKIFTSDSDKIIFLNERD